MLVFNLQSSILNIKPLRFTCKLMDRYEITRAF